MSVSVANVYTKYSGQLHSYLFRSYWHFQIFFFLWYESLLQLLAKCTLPTMILNAETEIKKIGQSGALIF